MRYFNITKLPASAELDRELGEPSLGKILMNIFKGFES